MALRVVGRTMHSSWRWHRNEAINFTRLKASFCPLTSAFLSPSACFSVAVRKRQKKHAYDTRKEEDANLIAEFKAFMLEAQRSEPPLDGTVHGEAQFNKRYQETMDDFWTTHSSTLPASAILKLLNCEIENVKIHPQYPLTLTSRGALELIKKLLVEKNEISSTDTICELMKCNSLFNQIGNDNVNMYKYLREKVMMNINDSRSIFQILKCLSMMSSTIPSNANSNFTSIARTAMNAIVEHHRETNKDKIISSTEVDYISRCISKFCELGLNKSLQIDVCRCLDEVFVKRLIEIENDMATESDQLFSLENIIDILKGVGNLESTSTTVEDVLSLVFRLMKKAHIAEVILHKPERGLEVLKTLRTKITHDQSIEIFETVCTYFEEAPLKTQKKLSLNNCSAVLNLLRDTNNSSCKIQEALYKIARTIDTAYPDGESLSMRSFVHAIKGVNSMLADEGSVLAVVGALTSRLSMHVKNDQKISVPIGTIFSSLPLLNAKSEVYRNLLSRIDHYLEKYDVTLLNDISSTQMSMCFYELRKLNTRDSKIVEKLMSKLVCILKARTNHMEWSGKELSLLMKGLHNMKNDVEAVTDCLQCVKNVMANNRSIILSNEDIGFFISGFQNMTADETTLGLLDELCNNIETGLERSQIDSRHSTKKDMMSLSSALGGLSKMNANDDAIRRTLSLLYNKLCNKLLVQSRTDGLVQYSFYGLHNMNFEQKEVANIVEFLLRHMKATKKFDLAKLCKILHSLKYQKYGPVVNLVLETVYEKLLSSDPSQINPRLISLALYGLTEMSTESSVLRILTFFSDVIENLPDNCMKSDDMELLFPAFKTMDSSDDQVRSILIALVEKMKKMKDPLSVKTKVKVLYGLQNMNHNDDVVKSLFEIIVSGTNSNSIDDNTYAPKSISLCLYNIRNFPNTTIEINKLLEMLALNVKKCSGY